MEYSLPIKDFQPPSRESFKNALAPLIWYFNPKVFGLEDLRLGEKYLLVGNHSLYGGIDCPLSLGILYIETGIFPRGMGDHLHFSIPRWRDLCLRLGSVPGTRENCASLMEDGQCIVVYPGGGREVCKRKGESYKLIWKQRTGFVRLAIQFGYKIIPVASVGADNSFSILFDSDDFRNSAIGRQLFKNDAIAKWLRNGDVIPPLARGLGPTIIPRPERYYFSFGKPIDTKPWAGKHDDNKALFKIRGLVENALNEQIRELLHHREQDRDAGLVRRLLTRL